MKRCLKFISTYGWVIMVIVLVVCMICAMGYFGVLPKPNLEQNMGYFGMLPKPNLEQNVTFNVSNYPEVWIHLYVHVRDSGAVDVICFDYACCNVTFEDNSGEEELMIVIPDYLVVVENGTFNGHRAFYLRSLEEEQSVHQAETSLLGGDCYAIVS